MERTKLISMRLTTENLALIDELLSSRRYLSRSRVINAILEAMLKCANANAVADIIHSFDPYGDGICIQVTTKDKVYKTTI